MLIPTQVLGKADQCNEHVRWRRNPQQQNKSGVQDQDVSAACSVPGFSQSLLVTNRAARTKLYCNRQELPVPPQAQFNLTTCV